MNSLFRKHPVLLLSYPLFVLISIGFISSGTTSHNLTYLLIGFGSLCIELMILLILFLWSL